MPKGKGTKKRIAKKGVPFTIEEANTSYSTFPQETASSAPWWMRRSTLIIGVIVILVAVFLYRNRGFFIAATVNGQPISRNTFDQKLRQRYGASMLDGLIGEAIITQEAAKKGITINQKQIDEEIEKTKSSLPAGMNFEEALSFQGLSPEDFKSQIRIRLMVDRLLKDQATISATEVDTFIAQNKKSLTATSEAEMKKEAEQIVRGQKVQDLFQTWYQDLRKKATIQKFL